MFKNLSTKQKLLHNMISSQVGLVTVGVSGYLGYHTFSISSIVLFSIYRSWSNYIIMKYTTQNIKKFEIYFNDLINYILMKQNKIAKEPNPGKDDMGMILTQLNNAVDTIEKNMQNDMKLMGEIVLTTDKIEQGIFTCRIKALTTNPMLRTLKKNINKMVDVLEKTIIDVSTVAKTYADDDYTKSVTIPKKIKADMKVLLESVNKLGKALSKSAQSNLSNGQHLQSNSATMTQSVNILADKANQQAASLEETASSVEEITSITRNNTSNTNKMSELGSSVQKAVSNGSSLAHQTSIAMDSINSQVLAINEAISVIDQISFQTNILSLNAAVEAATAGEAGKGFAVVAQEVRNLANKSADAANEIKALVENAANKADEGKKVTDDMIKGYDLLDTNFNETINLINAVSLASKEQMAGIEQINDAVTILDKVTQENASEANSVAKIASDVSLMANNLVEDALTKRFN